MSQRPSSITELRGIGPKVFLSYSFQDRTSADQLSSYLQGQGFQVRKEDETSLVGRRLGEELPRRIGDAECFIPLITTASSDSHWVREEFSYAEKWSRNKELLIAPVVLSSDGPVSWLRDFAYIDARREGLSPSVLDVTKSVLLSSVRLLQIEDDHPLHLLHADAEHLFDSDSLGKRVIFDSTGYWLRLIDKLISWGEQLDPAKGAQQFIEQEIERRGRIQRICSVIDHVLYALAEEVANKRADGIVEEEHLTLVVQFFYRMVFAKFLFDDFHMGVPARIVSMADSSQEEFAQLKEIALEGTDGKLGFGFFMEMSKLDKAIGWALTKALLAHSDLSNYDTSRRTLVALSLTLGRHKRASLHGASSHIRIQVPKLCVPYLLGTELLPHPTAKRWAWTLFALPQIAIEAMEIGSVLIRRGAAEHMVPESIRNGTGWDVEDYDRIVQTN